MYKDKNHTSINKIITMILIVSLMMFLFTGCGGSADTDHNSDATSDTGSSQVMIRLESVFPWAL